MVRNYVSFVTESQDGIYGASLEGLPPAGGSLAKRFASSLADSGYQVTEPSNHEDYAWQFDVSSGKTKFWLLLGYVGDGVREWMLLSKPTLGVVGRLFGKSKDEEHQALSLRVDGVLREMGLDSIRWYTEADWDKEPDTTWTETP